MRGKAPEAAALLAGRLFNVCAAAQEAAVRSALGLPLDATRTRAVTAETLREHGVKLFLAWPALVDVEPDRHALALLARALEDEPMAAALRVSLFGPKGALPRNWTAFEGWLSAGTSVPARTLRAVNDDWDPAWGRVAGQDNGVGGRVAHHPLMEAIAGRTGQGILWRMAARLVEMKIVLSGHAPSPFRGPGVVEAARGTLVVHASLDAEGKVATFERRTPTDDMLAEDGPLRAALETLPANDDRLATLARLVVDVLDPCLAHEITVDRETGDGSANDA
jgi:hypothetical protein